MEAAGEKSGWVKLISLASLSLAVAVTACGEDGAEKASRDANSVDPHELLAEEPYMGVSCPTSNSIACDRIGLSVLLDRPALRVTASIDGKRFSLGDPDWSGRVNDQGNRRLFAGFLQPAGLSEDDSALRVEPENGDLWFGREPVAAKVELEVVYGEGKRVVTEDRVSLSPGWG